MKLFKMTLVASVVVASVAAQAGSEPGTGFTGSYHDWTKTNITTAASGANTGSYVGGGGGTSAKAFYSLSSGAPIVVTDKTSGMFYVPAAGIPVTATVTGDGQTAYQVQTTSTTAPVVTNSTSTAFATVRITIGQCTKCHTPHVAKQTNLLWNHTLNTGVYNWDAPATTAGTTFATFKGDTYKGSTPKCLSCHDGTIGSSDGVWFKDAFLAADPRSSSATLATSTGISFGLKMNKTHPVAMPYPYNNSQNTYNGTHNGAETAWNEWVADPKSKGIRLYNDADGLGTITAGAVAGKTGIECNSCHDVHNGSTVQDEFLVRGKVSGNTDYICTKCHKK